MKMNPFKFPKRVSAAFWALMLFFLFGPEIAAKVTSPPTQSRQEVLEVKVHGLIADPASMQPVVLLVDPSEGRVMPIWIGPNEAAVIQGELAGTPFPRPTTHDLLERVIQRLNGTLRRVIITHEKDNTYYATLVLEKDETSLELDARPSDSIALALKFQIPIFISRSLFAERAFLLQGQKEPEESYGLTVQALTPVLAQSFSFREGTGVLIAHVEEGSPAQRDGIQRGDILVEIGGQPLTDAAALRSALANLKGPSKARIFRNGAFSVLTLHTAH